MVAFGTYRMRVIKILQVYQIMPSFHSDENEENHVSKNFNKNDNVLQGPEKNLLHARSTTQQNAVRKLKRKLCCFGCKVGLWAVFCLSDSNWPETTCFIARFKKTFGTPASNLAILLETNICLKIVHVPGKALVVADALSRAPWTPAFAATKTGSLNKSNSPLFSFKAKHTRNGTFCRWTFRRWTFRRWTLGGRYCFQIF